MSSEVALQSIEYISDQYQKNPNWEHLFISFFGGEPLLNRKVMSLVCDEISNLPLIRDKTKYILTTNLTLLTDSDLKFIKQHGFSNVQVALDGSKGRHDSLRKFKSGRGSFDTVIKNINKLVTEGISVTVFLNFGHESEASYDDLLQGIRSLLPINEIDFVLNPITSSLCNTNCEMAFVDPDQESDLYLEIYRKFRDNGIPVQAFGQATMVCMLTRDGSCMIDPKGQIYKCCLLLGTEYKGGNVSTKSYSSLTYELISSTPWEQCLVDECEYLPICGGGCRALALLHSGDILSTYCRLSDYFERLFPEILKDHFTELIEGGNTNESGYS